MSADQFRASLLVKAINYDAIAHFHTTSSGVGKSGNRTVRNHKPGQRQ